MSPAKMRFWVVILGAGLVGAAQLHADDPFSRFRAENEVKKQKLVADVGAALALSSKLESSDPAQARDVLRNAQIKLESDILLSKTERDRLLAAIANRLVIVNDAARARQRNDELNAQRVATEQELKYRQQTQPSRTPTGIADDFIRTGRDVVSSADAARLRREAGVVQIGRENELSAAQMTEQYITERFIARTDLRKTKMSKEEQHVMKMLNSTMSIDFQSARFKEVIEYLQERTEMPIIVDEMSLREVGIEYDDPVTFKAPKLTVRTILRKILGDRGLSYFVKEGTVQVVSAQRARETMVVRTYPISDFLNVNPAFGPFMGRAIMYQQVQQLINAIQTTVDPAIWQQGGSIQFLEAPVPTLVIRAPAELHYSMSTFGN